MDAEVARPDTNPSSRGARVEPPHQQYPVSQPPPNPLPESTLTEDDAFWLNNALDDGIALDGATDMMNVDMDAILAQDNWLEASNGDSIDWAQWDAWFGNLEPMHSNIGTGPE